MGANRLIPHVAFLYEDGANRSILNGFLKSFHVNDRQVSEFKDGEGWSGTLDLFAREYSPLLKRNQFTQLVILLDFDKKHLWGPRLEDLVAEHKDRVFVLGTNPKPEVTQKLLKKNLEAIGLELADDCFEGKTTTWSHESLAHNQAELIRMSETIQPILRRV